MKNRIILFISLVFLIGIFYFSLPNKSGKVVVCDVGQGDAILSTYKNIQMLIDVGPDNKKVLECLSKYLPFWDKTIEVVILTHGDSDHIGALNSLTNSYKIEKFFTNGLLDKTIEQKIYSQKIGQNDVISTNMFDFEVVNPPKSEGLVDGNENSVAGYLVYPSTGSEEKWRMFLGGDIDKETEQRLVWTTVLRQHYGLVNVLKVAHHGSENGTSDELLDFLKPETAVISVGKNNRYGHPRKEVIERLNKRNIKIKRTDEIGDIVYNL